MTDFDWRLAVIGVLILWLIDRVIARAFLHELERDCADYDRALSNHIEECILRWDREAEMEAQELAERAPRRIGR